MKKLLILILTCTLFLASCVAPTGYCGDNVCDFGEQYTCPQDCGTQPTIPTPQPQIQTPALPQATLPATTAKIMLPSGVSGGVIILELKEKDTIQTQTGILELTLIDLATQSAVFNYNGLLFPKIKAGEKEIASNGDIILLIDLYKNPSGDYVIDAAIIPKGVEYELLQGVKEQDVVSTKLETLELVSISLSAGTASLKLGGVPASAAEKGITQTIYGVDITPLKIGIGFHAYKVPVVDVLLMAKPANRGVMVCDDPDGGWGPDKNAEVSMWDRIICTEKCEVINGQDYIFECFCGNKQAKGGGQGSGRELCQYGCNNGSCLAAPTQVSAFTNQTTEVYYIVDDTAPASDVVLASDLANSFPSYSSSAMLDSQVGIKDLDDKLGVYIYYGSAVIILGQNAQAKLAALAGDTQVYLRTKHDIYSAIKLNTEMPDDNFARYFVKTFKELYKGDKKETAFGDLEVTDLYGPPNQGSYYSSFTLNGVAFNNISFGSQFHPQLGRLFVTDMYQGRKGAAIDIALVPPSKDVYSAGGQQKGGVLGPWNKRFEIVDFTQNDATYMIVKEGITAKMLGQASTVQGTTVVPTKVYSYNNVQYLNTLLAKDV